MNEASDSFPILPGDWLGMIGGGQLERMFCHAAQSLGYKVAVLDPDEHSPAGAVAELHIRAGYQDSAGLEQLSARCQAIAIELEKVPSPPQRTLPLLLRLQNRTDLYSEKEGFVGGSYGGG